MQLNRIRICLIVLIFSVVLISACRKKPEINFTTRNGAFIQTNSAYVIIGNIAIKTNSPLNTDEFKKFMLRENALEKIENSSSPDHIEKFVDGAWALAKDYPNRPNGYQSIMSAIGDYQYLGKPDRARALAQEMIDSSAPDYFKQWAKGFLYRLDSMGKPVEIKFIAIDGRDVDLAKMKGNVVLVDFWGDDNELPQVKAAFEKFHAQGFEIIGIYNSTDKNRMEEFLKKYDISWPQYFVGKQMNKFAVEFGIDGFPQMFLVDKEGCLRFDNVRAGNFHPKGDTTSFEEKISKLLAEQ
ncbi:MAG TPA: TlpA disulfide reductase family protein [Verrucomicrobiae bacterium]